MNFSIQPNLENDYVQILPLEINDFESLYQVAKDKKIWEQHPCHNRWKEDVFKVFFKEAVESKGAFKIIDKTTGGLIGSTRYYDYSENDKSIVIGYTFIAVNYWGTGINSSIKKLMIDYIFQYVDKIYFHIGSTNFRSQKAIAKINAIKTSKEITVTDGNSSYINYLYELKKENWR